ncbi:hypothetical protein K8I61_13315 [bacterium]|nr:hypothetical protein [bacterium]
MSGAAIARWTAVVIGALTVFRFSDPPPLPSGVGAEDMAGALAATSVVRIAAALAALAVALARGGIAEMRGAIRDRANLRGDDVFAFVAAVAFAGLATHLLEATVARAAAGVADPVSSIAGTLGPILSILAIGAAWFVALVGFGRAALVIAVRVSSRDTSSNDVERQRRPIEDAFFVGVAAVVALLQLWHFVLPVNAIASLTFLAVGCALFALGLTRANEPRDRSGDARRTTRRTVLFVVAVACVLTNRALVAPRAPDFGLYHLPLLNWICEAPIVPGLGNLHGRFAFNNASFLFVSLVDFGSCAPNSPYLAATLAFVVAIVRLARGAAFGAGGASSFARAFAALMLVPVGGWASGGLVQNPSPDVYIYIYGAMLALWLAEMADIVPAPLRSRFKLRNQGAFALNEGEERALAPMPAGAFALVAFAGVATKLTFVVYAGAALAVALVFVASRRGRAFAAIALAGMIVMAPWIARGYVLSGYPLYPATVAPAGVDWRVTKTQAALEMEIIRAVARDPSYVRSGVLPPDWRARWLARHLSRPFDVFVPLGLAAIALAAFGAARRRWHGRALVLAPAIVTLPFWLLTAPDPRFAGASFWALAAGGLALWAMESRAFAGFALRAAATVSIGLMIALHIAPPIHEPCEGGLPAFHRFACGRRALPAVDARPMMTRSGLRLYVPASALCFDAPRPCAPTALPGLSARDAGRGFRMDKMDEMD